MGDKNPKKQKKQKKKKQETVMPQLIPAPQAESKPAAKPNH